MALLVVVPSKLVHDGVSEENASVGPLAGMEVDLFPLNSLAHHLTVLFAGSHTGIGREGEEHNIIMKF